MLREADMNSSEGQEMAERGGVMFPPGVFLDEEPFSYGRLWRRSSGASSTID